MWKMFRTALLLLAALLTPGGFVLLALWKLLKRLQLRPEIPLPLHGPSGEIIFTKADWERHVAQMQPVRWAVTRLMDYPRRRRQAKLPRMKHKDMILSWPFRAMASWVEANHPQVFNPPQTHDPLYDAYWYAMEEVRILYAWWLGRQERIDLLDKEDPSVREYHQEVMREEDQHMLARLVNVRTYLG